MYIIIIINLKEDKRERETELILTGDILMKTVSQARRVHLKGVTVATSAAASNTLLLCARICAERTVGRSWSSDRILVMVFTM